MPYHVIVRYINFRKHLRQTCNRSFLIGLAGTKPNIPHQNVTNSKFIHFQKKRAACLLRRQKKALLELAESRGLPKDTLTALAERLLATEEARNARTTSVTDMIAKLGPMFGLLGTLIPLGPGIVALGQGDTVTLSESMNVAFDTTIAGVISAAVASVISHIRKRWYNDDMVSLETLMEAVLEEVTSDVEG
mgnify:CR=1 FL=1